MVSSLFPFTFISFLPALFCIIASLFTLPALTASNESPNDVDETTGHVRHRPSAARPRLSSLSFQDLGAYTLRHFDTRDKIERFLDFCDQPPFSLPSSNFSESLSLKNQGLKIVLTLLKRATTEKQQENFDFPRSLPKILGPESAPSQQNDGVDLALSQPSFLAPHTVTNSSEAGSIDLANLGIPSLSLAPLEYMWDAIMNTKDEPSQNVKNPSLLPHEEFFPTPLSPSSWKPMKCDDFWRNGVMSSSDFGSLPSEGPWKVPEPGHLNCPNCTLGHTLAQANEANQEDLSFLPLPWGETHSGVLSPSVSPWADSSEDEATYWAQQQLNRWLLWEKRGEEPTEAIPPEKEDILKGSFSSSPHIHLLFQPAAGDGETEEMSQHHHQAIKEDVRRILFGLVDQLNSLNS